MPKVHPNELLQQLGLLNSPTVANAIELFNARPRNVGFVSGEIRCIFPDLPVMVGYACTATIRASSEGDPGGRVARDAFWDHVLSMPAPRVIVIHDEDDPPAIGSYWGEVNSSVFKALGAVGVVTDGGVRDLDEVHPLGFQFFARHVIVSHAYVHLTGVGQPVSIGGMIVHPGDLLHGDKHGVIQIPHEVAPGVPEAARRMEEYERPVIDYCKSIDFDVERLRSLVQQNLPRPMDVPSSGATSRQAY